MRSSLQPCLRCCGFIAKGVLAGGHCLRKRVRHMPDLPEFHSWMERQGKLPARERFRFRKANLWISRGVVRKLVHRRIVVRRLYAGVAKCANYISPVSELGKQYRQNVM